MHQVLLFYKYVTIENPATFAEKLRAWAEEHKLTGRAIVAEEGINATLEGTIEATEAFVKLLKRDGRFSDIHIKRSAGTGHTFPKLSVKVRNEIVGTRFPKEVDPRVKTAPHLSAQEMKQWIESEKNIAIVDMRNDYEYASGHFKNSVQPNIRNSRELPEKVVALEPLKGKKIITVCTGGVRCEKMSAYLLHKGFTDVYQLDGGIHTYMEQYPGEDFLGTLYTFDGRKVMDFGGAREVIGKCTHCGTATETYINCKNDECHLHFLVCPEHNHGDMQSYCSAACEERDIVHVKTR